VLTTFTEKSYLAHGILCHGSVAHRVDSAPAHMRETRAESCMKLLVEDVVPVAIVWVCLIELQGLVVVQDSEVENKA
jgi:hypothetical protein